MKQFDFYRLNKEFLLKVQIYNRSFVVQNTSRMQAISYKKNKHNFSAGPSILAPEVFEEAAKAVLDFQGSGLSILEISHRSPAFGQVMEEAIALVRALLQVPQDFAVLFLTGGASTQFFMTAMNFLDDTKKAGYINTGTWSAKAIKEAKAFGTVVELASSKDQNYSYIPKDFDIPTDLDYIHITSNNTVFGTQYHKWPDTEIPLVVDASSDIFSRIIPWDRMMCVYAGAQKNMGPAGTTLVIIRKDALQKVNRQIPTMLDYSTHVAKNSMFNTPPVFPIFVSLLNLRWLKKHGGISAMQAKNADKAGFLYSEIDRNPLFEGTVLPEDRSIMNINFVLKNPELEADFLKACELKDIVAIKGHRSVGGFRASMYNAMNIDSVELLVQTMKQFEQDVT